jgi:hypothetical protein
MTRLLPIALILVLVVAACDKSKFQTRPSLSLKSQNGNLIPSGASLQLEFEFTDKEGDVSDTLFVKKIRTNRIVVPTIRDSFKLAVPQFPKNTQGVVLVTLDHTFYLASAQNPPRDPITNDPQDDTLMLKFAIRDKAKNISDTVTVGPIIVIR